MDFDVSSATTAITAGVAAIATVGAALLAPNVAKAVWRMVRGAIK